MNKFTKFATPIVLTGLLTVGIGASGTLDKLKTGLENVLQNYASTMKQETRNVLADHTTGYEVRNVHSGDTVWGYVREMESPEFSDFLRDNGMDYHSVAGYIIEINDGPPKVNDIYKVPEFEYR